MDGSDLLPRTGGPDILRTGGQVAVTRRFNEGGVGVVEAGTGTGKSLAYLLPTVRWASYNFV